MRAARWSEFGGSRVSRRNCRVRPARKRHIEAVLPAGHAIEGDADLLGRAVLATLHNAVKYTPRANISRTRHDARRARRVAGARRRPRIQRRRARPRLRSVLARRRCARARRRFGIGLGDRRRDRPALRRRDRDRQRGVRRRRGDHGLSSRRKALRPGRAAKRLARASAAGRKLVWQRGRGEVNLAAPRDRRRFAAPNTRQRIQTPSAEGGPPRNGGRGGARGATKTGGDFGWFWVRYK
jgi:hypothetical protein